MQTDTAPERRWTPTEYARALAMAYATRQAQAPESAVEITRNAKGDYQYRVAGVAGEDETLAAVATRVLSIARDLDTDLPLSRTQEYGRTYLPNEKGK
jgi:hypothetical protein